MKKKYIIFTKKIKFLNKILKKQPFKKKFIEWLSVTMGLIGMYLFVKEVIDTYETEFSFPFELTVIVVVLSGLIGYFTLLLKNKSMFNRTFEWTNGNQVTVVIGDYFDTLKDYPEGVAVSGMSSNINTSKAKKDSIFYGIYKEYCSANGEEIRVEAAAKFDKEVIKGRNDSLILSKKRIENVCELGEVSKVSFTNIEGKTRYAFFISNSQIEKNRDEFYGSMKTFDSFDKLWESFTEFNIFPAPLVMPLLGSGHSKDNSEMSSAIGIVESFFEYCYIKKEGKKEDKTIVNSIVLSIPIEFVTEGKINIVDLHNYIELKDNLLNILYVNKGKYEKIIG